jgi:hypothetical protein
MHLHYPERLRAMPADLHRRLLAVTDGSVTESDDAIEGPVAF